MTLDTTSDIPTSPGSYEAKLNVELKGGTKLLMPGMSCKVKLTPYLKKDALTVPPSAVVTDELDDQKQTVEVLEKDGTTKTRPVTVGRKTDKLVEILSGTERGRAGRNRAEEGVKGRDQGSGARRQGLVVRGGQFTARLRRLFSCCSSGVVVLGDWRLQMRWAWLTALVFICLPVLAEDASPPAPPAAAVTGPKPKAIEPPAATRDRATRSTAASPSC